MSPVLCSAQHSAQHSAQPKTGQLKGIVGKSLSFPEKVLKSGNLLYGDLGNIAQVYPVKQSNTNLVKRFKNRLHWNNVTGVFTLTDLQIDDSGVYTVENVDGDEEKTAHIFQLTVYFLSKPQVTVHDSSSCSVVCSVENGKDVTLSWYRGEEKLNQTSSPDLNITLSLPLKVDVQTRDSYRCEAANPVSKENAVVPNPCIESDPSKVADGDEMTRGSLIIAVICVLVASGLVGLAIYLKRRNGHSHTDSPERKQDVIQYAEITHIKPADNQEERRGIPDLDQLRDNTNLTLVYYTH
ncbi:SLAM family member 5-like [Salvelinus sp. IW2-2015]|uniref:SLAM family member 5-like n=1 Tax=Salvelinus sp. IW2-2015 TaxID=2691554 RepID=UPI0038D4FA29